MVEPTIAGRVPIAAEVVEGKTYHWCSCGNSANQPFCDGSHKGSEFLPTAYVATKTGQVFFCACKHSGKGPLCDGTHKSL